MTEVIGSLLWSPVMALSTQLIFVVLLAISIGALASSRNLEELQARAATDYLVPLLHEDVAKYVFSGNRDYHLIVTVVSEKDPKASCPACPYVHLKLLRHLYQVIFEN